MRRDALDATSSATSSTLYSSHKFLIHISGKDRPDMKLFWRVWAEDRQTTLYLDLQNILRRCSDDMESVRT